MVECNVSATNLRHIGFEVNKQFMTTNISFDTRVMKEEYLSVISDDECRLETDICFTAIICNTWTTCNVCHT